MAKKVIRPLRSEADYNAVLTIVFSLALIFLATRAEAQEMWSCAYLNYETPPQSVNADLRIGTGEVQLCFPPSGGAHLGFCRVYRVIENNQMGIVGVDSVAWDMRGRNHYV